MRALLGYLLAGALLGTVLPGVLLNLAVAEDIAPAQETQAETRETAPAGETLTALLRLEDGETVCMDMDDYLTGVVLAEMPASFEPEALKAQAVAARTYARKASLTGGKHGDGSVCGDSACCQAYLAEADYIAQGGTAMGAAKIRAAVEATSGLVLTYGGELIEATYFSCSGGSTEDALAVWGTDYPYLRAVDSPGEEKAARYTATVTLTPEEFQAALGLTLEGSPEEWFHDVEFTSGGGVASMGIGSGRFSGVHLRTALGLNSTCFSVSADTSAITITTRGYGHRVGLSQYGADAMAVTGSSYQEILSHYYPGTELSYAEGE